MVASRRKARKRRYKERNISRYNSEYCCKLIVIELLNVLEKKYASRKPLYIVLGDFNLYIEKADLPVGWDRQQIDRNTARNLRSRRPFDHILTSGFTEVERFAREFSPLPLRLEGDDGAVSYGFSDAANLLFDGREAISGEDLEHVSLNSSDTTLLGNIISSTGLIGSR